MLFKIKRRDIQAHALNKIRLQYITIQLHFGNGPLYISNMNSECPIVSWGNCTPSRWYNLLIGQTHLQNHASRLTFARGTWGRSRTEYHLPQLACLNDHLVNRSVKSYITWMLRQESFRIFAVTVSTGELLNLWNSCRLFTTTIAITAVWCRQYH